MISGAATTTKRKTVIPDVTNDKENSGSANQCGNGVKVKSNGDAPTKISSYNNSKPKVGSKSKQHPSASKQKKVDSASKSVPSDGNSGAHPSLHHLLPLPLVCTVLICSGVFWITSFRDVMATGKPILDRLGAWVGQVDTDASYLQYTKSTDWFDDTHGWKSKQGGLSTISSVTTDANNMGGLFIRKMCGVAGLVYHTTKLWPIVFQHPPQFDATKKSKGGRRWVGASWSAGHYDPLLTLGMIGNVCIAMFYLSRMNDLKDAGAQGMGQVFLLMSFIESFVFGMYLLSRRTKNDNATSGGQVVVDIATTGEYDPMEDPKSLPSRIVARTVFIVSSLISLISLRELFFPGTIIPFLPRDDIYLEWTGAFLHSPPPDTVEADENGLGAPLFAGDKFVSQLLGLYLSLGCMFKVCSAHGWSKGNRNMGKLESVDRSGVISSRMIWKVQSLGNMLLLGMLRLFTPAAKSASLDLRWHLMLVAYEAFILFFYAFW